MKIRIISPAGHIDQQLIATGADTLRSWGMDVDFSLHAKGQYGRYAGTPQARAFDIIDALNDSSVDILWCSRGGYGAQQILDLIPVDLVAHANKPVIGFSDITCLHALWQKAGIPSVHAPMMRHLAEYPDHRTTQTLHNMLLFYQGKGVWPRQNDLLRFSRNPMNILPDQHVTAPIIGGNFANISALHGTPYDFDYEGKILFIEDIGESPYKIDRMMNSLKLAGILDDLRGLLVGQMTGCDEDPEMPRPLLETIRELLQPYQIPVRFDVPVGHVVENYPVVEGALYTI